MQTIDAFDRQFHDEDGVQEFPDADALAGWRAMPSLQERRAHLRLKARPFHWVCCNKGCGDRRGYRFSVITQTIFETLKSAQALVQSRISDSDREERHQRSTGASCDLWRGIDARLSYGWYICHALARRDEGRRYAARWHRGSG